LQDGIDGLIVNSSMAYGRTNAFVSDADVHVKNAKDPSNVVSPARYATQADSAFLSPRPASVPVITKAAIAQGTPVSLKVSGSDDKYLGPSSGGYVVVGGDAGGKQVYKILGPEGSLTNNSTYKIMAGEYWLYETAKGNAGFWKSDTGDASSWKLEKVKAECAIKDDDLIRDGDVVKFSNGYWTDNYLCDYQSGYAAVGTYDRPNTWVIEVFR
jgi:hypothetical protein